jgi:hypothetical protein
MISERIFIPHRHEATASDMKDENRYLWHDFHANEIEDGARELEACLERPTLEQQAAAIAGLRLVW